ncbi:hypothetical protein [Candidatus Hodgkinia cicadicola]
MLWRGCSDVVCWYEVLRDLKKLLGFRVGFCSMTWMFDWSLSMSLWLGR